MAGEQAVDFTLLCWCVSFLALAAGLETRGRREKILQALLFHPERKERSGKMKGNRQDDQGIDGPEPCHLGALPASPGNHRGPSLLTLPWQRGMMKVPKRQESNRGVNTIKAEVLADELNLPSEVAQKFKGKRLSITVVKDGILLKPVGDPIAEAQGSLKGRLDTEKFLRWKQLEKALE